MIGDPNIWFNGLLFNERLPGDNTPGLNPGVAG